MDLRNRSKQRKLVYRGYHETFFCINQQQLFNTADKILERFNTIEAGYVYHKNFRKKNGIEAPSTGLYI